MKNGESVVRGHVDAERPNGTTISPHLDFNDHHTLPYGAWYYHTDSGDPRHREILSALYKQGSETLSFKITSIGMC